jgi:polyhydroxyalkanoate synthesis regulator phasin
MNDKFWKTLAIIFTVILIPLVFGNYVYTANYGGKLVEAMVYNDRLRQEEDKAIARDVQEKVNTVNRDVACKLDQIQMDITAIKVELARIKR